MVQERPPKLRRGDHRGVVFTPPQLAARLVDPLGSTAPSPPILDPACGEGALLLAALRARGGGPDAARSLFGIEIDGDLRRRALESLAKAAGLDPEALAANIVQADALDPATPWPQGTAVVANPPWLSFSGRHASRNEGIEKPSSPGGWPSLQGAFLHRIAVHCSSMGTRARLLLPGSMLELEGYSPLRREIANHVHLVGPPEELGERAFPGVLEPAVLVEFAAGAGAVDGGSFPAQGPIADGLRRLASFPKLPPRTFADPGVHTGNSSKSLVLDHPSEHCAPLRRGSDLGAFELSPPTKYLRLDLQKSQEHRFRIAPLEHYCSFPVLLRQTADRPIAARHLEPTYFRNSLLGVRPVDGLAPEFLVGLLNSRVAAFWHRENFRDARQRSFPQVKVGHLRSLPTPISTRADDSSLHDRVVELVRQLEAGDTRQREELDRLLIAGFGLDPESMRGEVGD